MIEAKDIFEVLCQRSLQQELVYYTNRRILLGDSLRHYVMTLPFGAVVQNFLVTHSLNKISKHYYESIRSLFVTKQIELK